MTKFDIENELIDLHGFAETISSAVMGLECLEERKKAGVSRAAEILADRLWDSHDIITKAQFDAINEAAQAA
ncbi:hypothetical protein ACUSIJ_24980 [Pseudochelatococcus sp. B33]